MASSFAKISESIINGHPVSFGETVYPPGGQGGPWLQHSFQVVLLMSGSLDLIIEGSPLPVPPGYAVLCQPRRREHFVFSATSESRHLWCTVNPALIPRELKRRLTGAMTVIPISKTLQALVDAGLQLICSPQVETSWRVGVEQSQPKKLIRGISQNEALDRLTWQLGLSVLECFLADRALAQGKTHGKEPLPVEKAISYIHEHFPENLDLKLLSRQAGVTPNHLIKLFREHSSITPMEYVWQVRTSRGMTLLRETGLNISEIAYQTGFKTPFHFARRFRDRYGKSPRAFRRTELLKAA